jgi:hypothetical protein
VLLIANKNNKIGYNMSTSHHRSLSPRHLTYARLRAQGISIPQAFKDAGYTSYKTNAYRLEARPDIQAAIADARTHRDELMSAGDTVKVKAEDLSDGAVASTFLLQILIDALSQARTQGDPKTVLAITSKIAELLAVKFTPDALKDATGDNSTASLLAQLEALK